MKPSTTPRVVETSKGPVGAADVAIMETIDASIMSMFNSNGICKITGLGLKKWAFLLLR